MKPALPLSPSLSTRLRRALAAAVFAPALLGQSPEARPKDPVVRPAPPTQQALQHDAGGQISAKRDGKPDAVARPAAAALSPDAHLVAWTLINGSDAREGSSLHLTSTTAPDAAREQLVTVAGATDCTYSDPAWAPDSKTLAFLSNCGSAGTAEEKRQQQIFLWSSNGGTVRQLTHLKGILQQLAWSPDGESLGFLFVKDATRSAGALDAMKPFAGVIGEDGVEIQRVNAVDVATGNTAWLSPTNLHVYEFAWAPNSHAIAFVGAKPPGENNWWVAQLYSMAVTRSIQETTTHSTGQVNGVAQAATDHHLSDSVQVELHTVLDPGTVAGPLHGLQIAVPRWSPDGRHIAFIGGLMSDQGSTGGDIYVVDAEGRNLVDVTPGIDGSPAYLAWASDYTVSFVEDRRGHTLFNAVNVNTRSIVPGAPVDLGEVSVGGGPIKDAVSVSDRLGDGKDRAVAFTRSSFTAPPEVWTYGPAGPRQLTHLNDGAKPTARTESVEWTNGPYHVQGWLTFPINYDPKSAGKYPLIVSVHGGPSASITARWGGGEWAEAGYFEFQPNPRGSFGQGEAFTAANRKDFGYGDLQDILAGLDTLEAKYPIDKNREGLTGWSYGGFMTMFAVTQTHRFRAAVAGAGLSDWLSYYGENSIDQWMTPFFGASVYDDPAVYARSSAITYIKNVKTPTLVIVGDRDGECPAPQSFEFWHALRDLGVKTQLVIYPNEGHGFRDAGHIHDRAQRTLQWFADNMPAGTTTSADVGTAGARGAGGR